MQDFVKIGQMASEISQFFRRWPLSAILDFQILIFFVARHANRGLCIINTKIGRTAAEIRILRFSKWLPSAILKKDFLNISGGQCASACKISYRYGSNPC